MNIAIVVRSLRMGGMERVAANLSDAFIQKGHNVTLIYLKNKPVQIKPENELADVRLVNLDKLTLKTGIGALWLFISAILNVFIRKSLFVWKGYFQSKIFFREIRKIEKNKGKFDLIIARGQGTFELIWNNNDKRFVQVCENIFSTDKRGFLNRIYARLLFNSKKVACVSSGVYESFLENSRENSIKPEDLRVITNPIDIDLIEQKAQINIPEIPDSPFILGLGRFVKQKNFPLLIKAYKILVNKYKVNQNLVLAGDGKERAHLEMLAEESGLKSRIFFPGFTNNPYAWMMHSDIFVLSSNFEGLGMVIIEAFASGTNVVATDSPGGVRDVMNTGILKNQLAELNPESLAAKIFEILNSEFPYKDVEIALNKFSPDNIVEQYLDYIKINKL
ncbi:MAG: glycosyltransferase [Candidatus Muiribacteriota bacterium]